MCLDEVKQIRHSLFTDRHVSPIIRFTVDRRLGDISWVGRTKEIGHVVVHVFDSNVEDTGVRVNAVGNAERNSESKKYSYKLLF